MGEKSLEIGYIYYGTHLKKDEKIFLKVAKLKGVKLILINTFKKLDLKRLKNRVKNCKIIFNNSAEDKAFKIVKFLEKEKKIVIESVRSYYQDENKWGFYLKCVKKKIPTPRTILLSKNIQDALNELKNFGKFPIVLKRIYGCCGEFVDKADDLEDAKIIIERFEKKSKNYIPVIAQEFIKSPSYRVLVINKKIMQAIVKRRGFWKKTGVYTKDFNKFRLSPKLVKLVNKIYNSFSIKVCGMDLFKKNNKWMVLEVNSTPSLDFIEEEHQRIIEQVMKLLIKEAKKVS